MSERAGLIPDVSRLDCPRQPRVPGTHCCLRAAGSAKSPWTGQESITCAASVRTGWW